MGVSENKGGYFISGVLGVSGHTQNKGYIILGSLESGSCYVGYYNRGPSETPIWKNE